MPDEHDVIVIGDVTAWELQGAYGVVVDRQSGSPATPWTRSRIGSTVHACSTPAMTSPSNERSTTWRRACRVRAPRRRYGG